MDLTSATVVAHSVWDGTEIISFRATFPQVAHKHMLKHRLFSQDDESTDASISTSSVRAIPMKRQIQLARDNMFVPQRFPKERSGMAATEYFEGDEHDAALADYLWAFEHAAAGAQRMTDRGIHKGIASRGLEPYGWATAIITTTLPGFKNFLAVREHPDAQDETQVVARKMREAYEASPPWETHWHLPFYPRERADRFEDYAIPSISKCARTSFGRELDDFSDEQHRSLLKRLLGNPMHAGPFDHVAIVRDVRAHIGNYSPPWVPLRFHWREFLPSIAAELDALS